MAHPIHIGEVGELDMFCFRTCSDPYARYISTDGAGQNGQKVDLNLDRQSTSRHHSSLTCTVSSQGTTEGGWRTTSAVDSAQAHLGAHTERRHWLISRQR
eukprot:9105994-Pyramimonas_sp.AAC.1